MQNKWDFSIQELDSIADQLIDLLQFPSVWALEGEMGAGKTTLVQRVLEKLGIEDFEGSPTYSLVNTYDLPDGRTVYHLDLYRLKDFQEVLDIGIEEILEDPNATCWIEWPKKIEALFPQHTIWLYLSVTDKGNRLLEIKA